MRLAADVEVVRPMLTVGARLEVEPGERVVIVGPNGAGKSTVLAAIAGLVRQDRGRVQLGDRVLEDTATRVHVEPHERRIGVVFQGGLLFPNMSVLDNVAFGPRARGASRELSAQSARRQLARVGLDHLAAARPSSLSGGEAQACALARALATDPDLLLLDEPFAALDVSSRVEVRRSVGDVLSGSQVPVVVVTHDPIEAISLADRMIVMERGAVTQEGSPDEIRTRPRSKYVGDLVGLNVLHGTASDGHAEVGDMALTTADRLTGECIVTFHPHAVALFPARPAGSMRNVWEARLTHVEQLGDRVRVVLDKPRGVTVEVTPAAAAELGLEPGVQIWASLKATEIEAFPA